MSYFINERDVYEVTCEELTNDFKAEVEQYTVTVKQNGEIVRRITIGFDRDFLPTQNMSDHDKCTYAMKKAARLYKGEDITEDTAVVADNFNSLKGKIATDDETDEKLAVLISRFFRKYPEPSSYILSPTDFFISTDFTFKEIVKRLGYFKARGILREAFGSDKIAHAYILGPEGFEKLEALRSAHSMNEHTQNKYFQLVSLSSKVKQPFAFVLMPFKEREIDQRVYFDIIKPTVEKELGICCIRSDEETKPGVINNQIFTMILKAKLIIAETTSRNPNVFYEVGMAHAFNKDVFIFNNSANKELPFDIITNRAVFYDDYEDLKKKIVENLKDHVS